MPADTEHFSAQLARLRAHLEARQPLPADLAAWTLSRVAEAAGSEVLKRQRDAHLFQAGELVGGSTRRRASEILAEARILDRLGRRLWDQSPLPGTVRGEVHAARCIAPIPGERRLRAILSSADALLVRGHFVPFKVP